MLKICLIVGAEENSILRAIPDKTTVIALDRNGKSWSALTFAHPLVRVILAEPLYRSYSILEGAPYHR